MGSLLRNISRIQGHGGQEEMGGCQNYGPFLGYPKRDHNFDNYPNKRIRGNMAVLFIDCFPEFCGSI